MSDPNESPSSEENGHPEQGVVTVTAPLEKLEGKLVLRIPLEKGGDAMAQCARGISQIRDGHLVIEIQGWLLGLLRVAEGDRVEVSNCDGRFNIQPADPPPLG